ncbi:sortase [Agrococcus sp. ARC_14]|uniref:sortase domain-containing protein n=1 Tax=Agrococcus sp. ARC_14 TaxID=2919927 RepID=UPI001F062FAE|nr:sortase [Agrococcus sp. ARC_14]MCH1883877.1 sortase [Agrococcus sp. ARC_14]
MKLHGTGRRLRLTAVAAALLLSLTACGTAGADTEPAASSAPAAPSATAEPAPPDTAPPTETPTAELAMDASTPVSVHIPALDRTADLIETGMRDDRRLEVPPDEEGSPASWYTGSPTPGERGASVLLGHVNSLSDESGVFYDLQSLELGDEVSVTREDGSVATFEIYQVESFAKDEFPTRAVYYPVTGAELRLITCDNLDGSTPDFPNNFVVFAELVSVA